MNQRWMLSSCAAIIAGLLGALWLGAADPPSETIPETEVLMRAKLTSSQKVLEGLLAEDYKLIAAGAGEMKRISEAARWHRDRDTVYQHYAIEFRRQCATLEGLARKRNHQGASFCYLHLTQTCISCHNYIRDSLRVSVRPDRGVELIPAQFPDH